MNASWISAVDEVGHRQRNSSPTGVLSHRSTRFDIIFSGSAKISREVPGSNVIPTRRRAKKSNGRLGLVGTTQLNIWKFGHVLLFSAALLLPLLLLSLAHLLCLTDSPDFPSFLKLSRTSLRSSLRLLLQAHYSRLYTCVPTWPGGVSTGSGGCLVCRRQ